MGELIEISWFFHREHVHEWIWRLFECEIGLDFDISFGYEDSSFLRAHSLILRMFCQGITNSGSGQFRFVDEEIKVDDVRCLLEFIYRGKTNVEKERLDVLKKAAEMLGLEVFVEIVNKIKNESNSTIEERDCLSQNVEINSESDENKIITLSYGGISNPVEEAEISSERKVEESANENAAEDLQSIPEITKQKIAVQEHSYSLKRKLSEVQAEIHNIESCQPASDHRIDCNSEVEDPQQLKKFKLKYSLRLRKKSEKNVLSKPVQNCKSKDEKMHQYICPRCGKNYNKLSLMKEHLASHSVNKVLSQCPFCPNQFRNLETHLAFKHHRDVKGNLLEKSLKCELCDYACSDKYLLQKHKKAKHGERCFKCDQCSYSSTTNGSLSKHKRQVHIMEKRFMCDTCGTFFKSRSCLKQHIRSHTGFRKECDICGLNVRGSYLGTHMKIHGNKRFKCVSCECIYRRKSDLKIHLKKIHKMEEEKINNVSASKEIIVEAEKSFENEEHSNKKKVSCDICGKILANCSLNRHNVLFHSAIDNLKRHKCCFDDCAMSFIYRSKLKTHLTKKHKMPDEEIEALFKKDFEEKIQEINEKRKLEESENLDKAENDIWNYGVHDTFEESIETMETEQSKTVYIENISGLENLFSCPVCKKTFKNEIVFTRHVKYHSAKNEPELNSSLKNVDQRKPLMCPICDRKFKRKLVLDRHIEAHSDPKALIKCPYCTHQSMYLEEHLAEKHQRDMYGNFLEKAFKCEQCEFSCTVKWKLLYHTKVKHGEKTHKCELCTFSSTTNGQLLKHKREVHTEEKKFVCETCGASFKSKNYLVKHRNTHLGMKFICEICGISLSSKHNVARHMKIHSNGDSSYRKITCPVCLTFGARDRHNLKEHLKKKHKLAEEEIVSLMQNI